MSKNWMMAAGLALAVVAGASNTHADPKPAPAPTATPAPAPAGFKRVELQRHDLATPNRETVVARGEFAPGGAAPRHTHPGDEIGYILEGEITVEIDGKPATKLKAGETFFIPAGTVHTARNASTAAAAVLSTYVVEKGKPLATPVK